MQEELSRHEEEGEIVKEPSESEESTESIVVYDLRCTVLSVD